LDGSFGWIGIANLPSAAAIAAYLPEAGFAEVFTANDNRVTMGGQFFPNGTGTTVEGGFEITGAWNFGSGTGHSEYVAAGFMPIVAAGHAGWALGVARSMLDDVRELAMSKVRMGDPSTLANKASFQTGLARHECMWRAARLLVVETFRDVEDTVESGAAL